MKYISGNQFKKIGIAALAALFALAAGLGLWQSKTDPKLIPEPSDKSLSSYYEQSEKIRQAGSASSQAVFIAGGDIMLSRTVAKTIKDSGNNALPFSEISQTLLTTDFNFANLESPISGSDTYNPSGSLIFNAPESYARELKNYNFKILNLANNHALDQGEKGLFHTQQFLNSLGIDQVGTGKNLDEAWSPKIVKANGIKIAFIGASYASINDGGKTQNQYVARIEDLQNLSAAVALAKKQADYVVVTMHAGTEYTHSANQSQTTFARKAVDLGADMVIGAHPHWVQGIEEYKGKYIFYSLGNFIFDQEWSSKTKQGLMLKITLAKQGGNRYLNDSAQTDEIQGQKTYATLKSVELLPIIIENYSTPRLANEKEGELILNSIGQEKSILK